MSSTLKFQFLINEMVWRLSPYMLYKLARNFGKLAPESFKALISDEEKKYAKITRLDKLTQDEKDEYKQFCYHFIRIVNGLRMGDSGDEAVMAAAHLISKCCSDDIRESLIQITEERNMSMPLDDYIVHVYVKLGKDPLHTAQRMNLSKQKASVSCYLPSDCFLQFSAAPQHARFPSEKLLAATQTHLQDFFQRRFKSSLCELVSGVHGSRFFISITHAAPYKQGMKTLENKLDNFVYQPVEYDTVVLDMATRELYIHLENFRKLVVREYIKSAGALFFEEEQYWGKTSKYSMEALNVATRASLKKLLDVEEAKKIISVPGAELAKIRIPEIALSKTARNGFKSTREYRNKQCLTNDLDSEDELLVKDGFQVERVKFSFDCQKQSEDFTVDMTLSREAKKVASGTNELQNTENWLNDRGLTNRTPQAPISFPEWFEKLSEAEQAKFAPRIEVEPRDALEGTALGGTIVSSNEPT